MNEELILAAEVNGGYLMRHQLLDLGHSDASIRRARQAGVLVRLRHGTYVPAVSWHDLSPAARHRVLTFSVLDKLGPGVAATHQSAAAIHDYDLYDVELGTVHVTRLDGSSGRREAGVVHHHGQVVPERDLVEIDGRLVVEPMRTVFEACSLASTESGMVLASSALRTDSFSKEELVEAGQRFDHWLGTRRARLAIRLADGRLETVGEARSLHMMWRHRIPHPELQWVVIDSNGVQIARTDFAWLLYRHTGEFDGLIKYGRLNPFSRDPGELIVKEKVREDLVRDEELGMSRWVWAGLAPRTQAQTAQKILQGMERSKRLYLRNATVIPLS